MRGAPSGAGARRCYLKSHSLDQGAKTYCNWSLSLRFLRCALERLARRPSEEDMQDLLERNPRPSAADVHAVMPSLEDLWPHEGGLEEDFSANPLVHLLEWRRHRAEPHSDGPGHDIAADWLKTAKLAG